MAVLCEILRALGLIAGLFILAQQFALGADSDERVQRVDV